MDTQSIVSQVLAAAAPLLVGLVSGVLVFLLGRLNTWIKAKIKSEILQSALLQVNEAVTATVNDVEKEVRVYLTDGKLSKEEASQLKALAKDRVFALAPAALDKLAKAGFERLEEYVVGKIEEKVSQIKPTAAQS